MIYDGKDLKLHIRLFITTTDAAKQTPKWKNRYKSERTMAHFTSEWKIWIFSPIFLTKTVLSHLCCVRGREGREEARAGVFVFAGPASTSVLSQRARPTTTTSSDILTPSSSLLTCILWLVSRWIMEQKQLKR